MALLTSDEPRTVSAVSGVQMSDAPRVSCIMIFLNAEPFIREAIQSVFAQTYHDWELLLVDDGSTDGSTAIARYFAQRHPAKVRYFEHPGHQNLGMSASRNLGLANARGRYLGFLDADDVWLPNKLRRQVAVLEAHPDTAMVFSPTEYWYSWTTRREEREHDFRSALGVPAGIVIEPPGLLKQWFQDGGATIPGICSVLARRDAMGGVGGFETSFRGTYEDQVFLLKMFLKHRVIAIDECLDRYRQHPGSCCARAIQDGEYHPSRPHPARRRFLEWLAEYFSAEGVQDPDILDGLNRARRPYRGWYRLVWPVERELRRVARIARRRLKRTWLRLVWARAKAAWRGHEYVPPDTKVRFGHLRRTTPISRQYGSDRGLPIDRHYIEAFLARHADDIRGRVLEVGDATYTRLFGGDRVMVSDILHVNATNPKATLIGDLASGDHLPANAFDCVILTQTLHLIYDVRAALRTVHRLLVPGGVALVTVPGISQISEDEWRTTWYWSFTTLSARRLFEEVFPAEHVAVAAHGNVLAATAFLQGLAAHELRDAELHYADPQYEMLITIRAVKPAPTQ
jgi:glycosyltransferase involved in cell wall biosynthesis